jgi:hypothetical protein
MHLKGLHFHPYLTSLATTVQKELSSSLIPQRSFGQYYSNPGREWKGKWCVSMGGVLFFPSLTLACSLSILDSPASCLPTASCCFCSSSPPICFAFFFSTPKQLQSPRTMSTACLIVDVLRSGKCDKLRKVLIEILRLPSDGDFFLLALSAKFSPLLNYYGGLTQSN